MPSTSILPSTTTPAYLVEPSIPATGVSSVVALCAQSMQAAAVSGLSWGARSALISVGGQVGGIAGPLISRHFLEYYPTDHATLPTTDNPDAYALSEAFGTMIGKLTGVCIGGLLLGPAQACAEALCIAVRRTVGEGFQYNIPSENGLAPSQRLTERAFCAASLIRPPIERPLLRKPVQREPSFAYMAEVAALDVICSGGTSALVQALVCYRNWNANGGVKGELTPVQANFTSDIDLLKRGAKAVVSGAAFDLIPGLLPLLTPVLSTETVQVITPILNTLMPVCGTVWRLDTWFELAPPPTSSISSAPLRPPPPLSPPSPLSLLPSPLSPLSAAPARVPTTAQANTLFAVGSEQDAKVIFPVVHPKTPAVAGRSNHQITRRKHLLIVPNDDTTTPGDNNNNSTERRSRSYTWHASSRE